MRTLSTGEKFLQRFTPAQRILATSEAQRDCGECRAVRCPRRASARYEWRATVRARAVLYNELMLPRLEATVIEQLILGAFLVIPLLIVAFLFSDELWQEHRHLHDMRPMHAPPRRHDWRHPLRRSRHRP
ncbi:hypothetical protein ACTJLC_07965 [Paraburkholderia sp. 22099]|uniref:hypothetical protein n=1 Tax=Paraburkholderia TaxID=1822464 RepID=UPI00285F55E6|nr:hypothetical protein [Paraburkholderia terricola]MDR6492823.1 hypothetical protein [Paraburkholderia terricola]